MTAHSKVFKEESLMITQTIHKRKRFKLEGKCSNREIKEARKREEKRKQKSQHCLMNLDLKCQMSSIWRVGIQCLLQITEVRAVLTERVP